MQTGDLTTLASVKAWLNTGSTAFPATNDVLLKRMVAAASRFVRSYLSRDLIAQDYTIVMDGLGQSQLFTPQYPIIAVAALSINGVVQNARTTPTGAGFAYNQQAIIANGVPFCQGFQNISLSYSAGYQSSTALNVGSDGSVDASALGLPWVCDRGVAYANGTKLTYVASAPAQGQYTIDQSGDDRPKYKFNAADANAAVTITYGYCPADLEQALIELIGERYKSRERIGMVSMDMAQQTVSYSQKDFNDYVDTTFNQYKNVVPLP